MRATFLTQGIQLLLVIATFGLLLWPLVTRGSKRKLAFKRLTVGANAVLVFSWQLFNLFLILTIQWSPIGNLLKIAVVILAFVYLFEWRYAHKRYAH
ncbi:hypothetical protein BN934_02125 [Lacticaseibacillus rhamnosus]|uniref:hypothetical protein n=1 Tax=Lacticaseibacillus rhamnosus TaxID=47715 RepID=UPI0005E3DE31|nr:hypothetical protein [Lacticaseibacillus rhamnosus]CDN23875.1 hypothetical protein BN934_02125 [Lacticaseibacillus rhamnosus]